MKEELPPGATPIAPEEEVGLIPAHITLRGELNELEQANILEAETWLLTKRNEIDIVDPAFLNQLHLRMFGSIWKWAGKYRKTERNIGIPAMNISFEMQRFCREVKGWHDDKTYSQDELAVRFHHKLVAIHCYPNGNGRHARLAADILIEQLGGSRFTWGSSRLDEAGDVRSAYIDALKSADHNDIGPLVEFVRS